MAQISHLQKAVSSVGAALNRHVNQGVILTIILQFGGAIAAFAMYSLAARVLSSVDFGHLGNVALRISNGKRRSPPGTGNVRPAVAQRICRR